MGSLRQAEEMSNSKTARARNGERSVPTPDIRGCNRNILEYMSLYIILIYRLPLKVLDLIGDVK